MIKQKQKFSVLKGEQTMFETSTMNGMPMMGGYNYQGMAQAQQKWSNVLTPEQISRLQKSENEFSLGITEEESLRARCNHRSADGTQDTLVYDPITQEARCTICGYKFRPIEPNVSMEDINEDVARLLDLLQTIKLMYIDLPDQAAAEYFQIIPLIEKVPKLFEYAAKNMTKHETYNWQYANRNMGAMNMFNNLQAIFSGGMAAPQQQPMVNPGMPVGMVPPTMGQPNPAFQQPMMGNAFGYPGAQQGMAYQPQSAGFQYTPNQQPAQTVAPQQTPINAPAAPETTETATVQQTVTV